MDALILFILWAVIGGLIVGALGRLVVPGPTAMTIGMTILVGIGGALLGGLVAVLLGVRTWLVYFIFQVLAAALLVYVVQRRPRRVV